MLSESRGRGRSTVGVHAGNYSIITPFSFPSCNPHFAPPRVDLGASGIPPLWGPNEVSNIPLQVEVFACMVCLPNEADCETY